MLKKHIEKQHEDGNKTIVEGLEEKEESPIAQDVCGWCLGPRPLGAPDCGPGRQDCREVFMREYRDWQEVEVPFTSF